MNKQDKHAIVGMIVLSLFLSCGAFLEGKVCRYIGFYSVLALFAYGVCCNLYPGILPEFKIGISGDCEDGDDGDGDGDGGCNGDGGDCGGGTDGGGDGCGGGGGE